MESKPGGMKSVITSKVLNKSLGLKRSCPKLKRSSTKTLSELLNQEGLLCLRSVTTDRLSRFSWLAAVKRTPPICSRRSAARGGDGAENTPLQLHEVAAIARSVVHASSAMAPAGLYRPLR